MHRQLRSKGALDRVRPPGDGGATLPTFVTTEPFSIGETITLGSRPVHTLAVVLRGGRRIEVGRGFDTGALEQLVCVLEGV